MYKLRRPFSSVFHIMKPEYTHVYGVDQKTWIDVGVFHGSVHTASGSEKVENGVMSVQTVKVVQCNYDKRLKASIRLLDSAGAYWDITGEPEDIDERHRFMQFKIRKVEGEGC